LIYHFSQSCDTAINLSAIPRYHLPCISNHENEKEVLIAPRTFFKVTDIQFILKIYVVNIKMLFKHSHYCLKMTWKRKC